MEFWPDNRPRVCLQAFSGWLMLNLWRKFVCSLPYSPAILSQNARSNRCPLWRINIDELTVGWALFNETRLLWFFWWIVLIANGSFEWRVEFHFRVCTWWTVSSYTAFRNTYMSLIPILRLGVFPFGTHCFVRMTLFGCDFLRDSNFHWKHFDEVFCTSEILEVSKI